MEFFSFGHVHFESEEKAAKFYEKYKSDEVIFGTSKIHFSESTQYKSKEKVMVSCLFYLLY